MQVNWMIVTYFVVGFFAIAGFSKGWWREALTTVTLAFLLFLLRQPEIALDLVEFVNGLVVTTWNFIPLSFQITLRDIINTIFDLDNIGGPPQLDPTSSGSWMIILAVMIAFSIMLSRRWLVDGVPTTQGSLLGLLIGGVNGFITLGLIREYLDGRSLPGSAGPATEIVLAGSSGVAPASSALSLQATNLPSFTVLDSIIPWFIIAIAILFVISMFRTRVFIDGNSQIGRKISYRTPPLYYSGAQSGPSDRQCIAILTSKGYGIIPPGGR